MSPRQFLSDTANVTFHLIAIPGILALASSWSLALIVLATGPGLLRDRLLALLLFVEGTAWGTGSGFLYVTDSTHVAWYLQAVFIAMLLALPACLLAVAGTLPTSLLAPLRSPAGLIVLAAWTVIAETCLVVYHQRFVGAIVPAWYATWDADLPPLSIDVINLVGLTGMVSLAGSLSAWHRSAPGSWGRAQARAFALAFGVHDAGLVCGMVLPGNVVPSPPSGQFSDVLVILSVNVTSLAFVLLLSYGILKVQLFDIDLRIKRGIRRSTVAGAFVVVFLVVEQLVQNWFTGQFGLLLGAIAAGLMLFALGHIRQFAAHVADRAMPDVAATPEYVAWRKFEVYRAAYEGLSADGLVSDKERATLDRLRVKLALTSADAIAIETEVRAERALA